AETTIKLLNNISNYKVLDKILVVDNCSTDNSFQILKKCENDKIEVIKTTINKGYGAGINYGIKYLEKSYDDANIFISNADIYIKQENDLAKLIKNINSDKYYIVAPIIDENGYINRGWKIPTALKDSLMNIPYIHRYLRKKILNYKDKHYSTKLSNVDVVSGCFLLTRISYMNNIGYFDENVFLYYEENIIAKKLKTIHKKTIINNSVIIYHNHSVSVDKSINSLKKYRILKKSQYYFHKNYNKSNYFTLLVLFLTNKATYIILIFLYSFRKLKK
ncbi:MAG TPA: glycosyltransferase family 2 protein, partial [Tenericutes bacterium]|nr:glycosyltransferase family 2 protein [Mycoplasmatota bacterium]